MFVVGQYYNYYVCVIVVAGTGEYEVILYIDNVEAKYVCDVITLYRVGRVPQCKEMDGLGPDYFLMYGGHFPPNNS